MNSCCFYLPVVDYQIMSDFKEVNYELEIKEIKTINSDSLRIKLNPKLGIPRNCRAKKLNIFFVLIDLKVEKNLYPDTLIFKLIKDENFVCSDNNNNCVTGNPRILVNENICFLKIFKDEIYFIQETQIESKIICVFNINKKSKFNIESQKFSVKLGNFITRGNYSFKTSNLVFYYKF